MSRRPVKVSTFRWCSLIASFAFLTAVNGHGDTKDKVDSDNGRKLFTKPLASCSEKACCQKNPLSGGGHRSLMLVSTLDGKMSALNMQQEGALEWSIETGDGDLLSSSISKLEVNRNGVITRLIPSLDGGLYQFDGETVEPVPFTADTLLSHSFRFNDDSTIVGGKHSHTYGIDARTGQIRYVCTSAGCQQVAGSGEDSDDDEVLIVTRHSKTVRAVEMRTGAEKWNFSVGEHELSYVSQSKRTSPRALTDESGSGDRTEDGDWLDVEEGDEDNTTTQQEEDDDDVTVDSCAPEDADNKYFEFPWWSGDDMGEEDDDDGGGGGGEGVELKVIVPSGMVIAVSKDDPGKILWKYKFNTPIANAWTLQDGTLESLDLFDAKNIPALSFDQPTVDGAENLPPSPAMYIGLHQKQIYVQPSVQIVHAYEDSLQAAMMQGHLSHLVMPKVNWKPYLASAPSRTPAAIELQNPTQITWDSDPSQCDSETGLSLWHAEYPYDPGYYLYYERGPIPLPDAGGGSGGAGSEDLSVYSPEMLTLWNWWKEVVTIVLLCSVLLHLTLVRVCYREPRATLPGMCVGAVSEGTAAEEEVQEIVYGEEARAEEIVAVPKPVEYESRYLTDFEQVACLGKGGFGVVYHARNRLDDCDYAVKRIPLRNSVAARGRVGREVKALAKLEHAGIVRYYNAWFESPPPGWQEQKDAETMAADIDGAESLSSPGPVTFSGYSRAADEAGAASSRSGVNSGRMKKTRGNQPSVFNPLKPFDDDEQSFSASGEVVGQDDTEESSEWTNSVHSPVGGEGDNMARSDALQDLHSGSSYGFVPREPTADSFSREESGSFCVEFERKPAGFVPVGDDSFGIDFKDDSESSCSSQRQNSSPPHIPFDKYSAQKSRGWNNNAESSCDIIVEDSRCGDKSRDNNEDKHAIDDEDDTTSNQASSSLASHMLSSSHATRPMTLDVIPESHEHSSVAASSSSSSPPVPKLYLYIQMQLCRKESLKDWLAENTLNRSREQSLDIFDQIVSAVDYVHDCGLMHRDLKPSNIFFSKDGTVKVGDFGLATEDCRSEGVVMTPMEHAHSTHKPHTNQVGTKLYMSPEQIAGKQYTNKVDIYALGLILFELFYPFATMMERGDVMQRVKRLDFPARFQKELDDECTMVRSLLSPIPAQRPTTTEILDNPMLLEIHALRLERRKRTNSRTRTFSTNSSNSNSNTSTHEEGDRDVAAAAAKTSSS